MMRLLAAGNRLSDAICRFSSAWMPSVGCRLSVVGCQMRLSRRSDAILSRFVHQSFDVGTRTEITVPVCENGCFSRTGTIPVAPVCTSIVLCENRDSMLISGLAVFRRFCLSGMWTLRIGLSWSSKMVRNCVLGQRFLLRRKRQSIDACTGANSRPRTIGRGPVAGVERDVVMIAPGSPTRKAGRNHAVWLQPPAHRLHNRVQWRVVAVHEGHIGASHIMTNGRINPANVPDIALKAVSYTHLTLPTT